MAAKPPKKNLACFPEDIFLDPPVLPPPLLYLPPGLLPKGWEQQGGMAAPSSPRALIDGLGLPAASKWAVGILE